MKMKKSYIKLALAAVCLTVATACEDMLEDKYQNPERTTQGDIGKFFTTMQDNNRVRPQYWEIRTFVGEHTGKYTQLLSFQNAPKRYQINSGYTEQRWSDYYTRSGNGSGVIAQYREIMKLYEEMDAETQARNEVFIQAANVVLLDQTSQIVDLWGDIPFSQAGGLNSTGSVVLAAYDDAQAIYNYTLEKLEEASTFFASATLTSDVAKTFSKQDIVLAGNLDKWRRYTNSLRLRLLMRISFVDEARAETEIMEMLNNPAQYPLVDEAGQNVLLHPLTNNTGDLNNALIEGSSIAATEAVLDEVMKPANDPRIRVFYDKGMENLPGGVQVPNPDYYALPVDAASEVQADILSKGKYAPLDSQTFRFNRKLPGTLINSSEVHFLRAEAFERWGSTDDAAEAYETALRHSIAFYFYLNDLGDGDEIAPTEMEITDFLSSPTVAYTGTQEEKLEKIWTQKWLNFGFLQSVQAWAEMRRTNTPDLTFVSDPATPLATMPPTGRLLYPQNEIIYNAANYEAVAAEDKIDSKIFWDVD